MATPAKLVHWGPDVSLPGFGSPFSDTSSVESMVSTSSLQYLNSQLIAHGFTTSPGLSLDGISNTDSDRVVKCLIGMLGQRMEDMSRTEELKTKLNTLSYDHGRFKSMHQDAIEMAANAERDMYMYKSRLTAATRSLQSTENAHKHTTVELQRSRTMIQGIRATHHAELKKKEKEIERMVEKWSKLSDMQVKMGAAVSGMRCANVEVVEGTDVLGKGQGFLEVALEQAEHARNQLAEENSNLRRLVLTAVNEVQAMLHISRSLTAEKDEEPVPFTLASLFPPTPHEIANVKLTSVLSALRESFSRLSGLPASTNPPTPKSSVPHNELKRLQTIIDTLRAELDRSREQSAEQAIHTQALFDQFAEDHRVMASDIGEMSLELMTAPAKDEEKHRLESMKRQLEEERKKFTEAAVRLGKEKATLEAERISFQDEKRSWKFEMMLAELPGTPDPAPASLARSKTASTKRVTKSPRKSPRKSPIKVGSGKRTRVLRRSSIGKVEPSYETEVLPPLPAPSFIARPAISLSQSLLPTSFVLPPPSPFSTLPTQPVLLPMSFSPPSPPDIRPAASLAQLSIPEHSNAKPPTTPTGVHRPFPMAKPFAPRMVHAYSPVRPSPLSRILMLGNSPPSPHPDPDSPSPLEPLAEEDEELSEADSPGPALLVVPNVPAEKVPDNPKGTNDSRDVISTTTAPVTTLKGRVFQPPEAKRLTAREKGKGKEFATANRPRGSGPVEKENDAKNLKPVVPTACIPAKVFSGTTAGIHGGKNVKPMLKPTTSRQRLMAKLPPGKMVARRVPVDSAEAGANAGRGRKVY